MLRLLVCPNSPNSPVFPVCRRMLMGFRFTRMFGLLSRLQHNLHTFQRIPLTFQRIPLTFRRILLIHSIRFSLPIFRRILLIHGFRFTLL